jgi:hypothetical protein
MIENRIGDLKTGKSYTPERQLNITEIQKATPSYIRSFQIIRKKFGNRNANRNDIGMSMIYFPSPQMQLLPV